MQKIRSESGLLLLFIQDLDLDPPRFGHPERDPIAPNEKLDRIAHRCKANQLDLLAFGEAHLHEPNGYGVIAGNVNNLSALALLEGIERRHDAGLISRDNDKAVRLVGWRTFGSVGGLLGCSAARQLDKHQRAFLGTKAEPMVVEGDDARGAGAQHADEHSFSQAHFLQPRGDLLPRIDVNNPSALAGTERLKRDLLQVTLLWKVTRLPGGWRF